MTNLADELERRLQLAKDHGQLSDNREVYIPSSWLPALLASLTGEGEPVAWQVKDYADGWITFYSHERARQEAEEMGGLIRPVYAGPAILALSASGGGE